MNALQTKTDTCVSLTTNCYAHDDDDDDDDDTAKNG